MDLPADGPFPYRPLEEDEIRLLHVQSSDSDLICLDLHTVQAPANQRFWALSYVWGPTDDPAVVLLNGQSFTITRNLYHALYEYRRHIFTNESKVTSAWLWVDAICINQNDQVEKSIQVPRMSEIYGKCERVLAWLGPVDNEEESSICKLEETLVSFSFSVEEDHVEDSRIKTFLELGKSDIKAAAEVELVRKALGSIGHRPWFRRIWILQEAVLAQKSPILLCGSCELGYDIFFKTWVLMLNPSEDGQLLYSFMAENPVRFKAIELAYKKILQSRSGTDQEHKKDLAAQEKQCAIDIFKLLNEATELEATVPHDRLYALLGLLSSNPLPKALQLDYIKSFERLCYDFVLFILEQKKDVRVLNLGAVGCFKDVPSWTPDLRENWMAKANLAPSLGSFFQISPDGKVLTMPAIVLGACISASSPATPDEDSGIVPTTAFLQFDESIIVPAAAIRRETRMSVMTEWLKYHFSSIYTDTQLEQNPAILQRIMLAYTCMVHNQPISSLGTRYGTEAQLQGAFGMVTDPIIQKALVGCSNFVLQDGTGGRLLHDSDIASAGDRICVFQGLSTPFLIRSTEAGDWRIIGQVSKWESNGAYLPEEILERYHWSFERYHLGKKTEHNVRMLDIQ
ncbi:hypothetical protein FVEN_g7809 [Fusarium venenatum]|uniref:Heterokaryon incompatibility domain-containing protein n=1 Tax=Fusarium venenatum TaxID=56646 RepID=A0A2L2TAD8_9HYPO|nr:uncharacterized protein FVRRES_07989 [Fusarium venenatum]KAG8354360.1 hypothetical protein FVEN_g7809 [Fusarium venenatum]KAH6964781.1 heterokaryon incompatibility protein-domain-containing protein [Fusarium venenatum]CEI67912.1 unnamed protein product [Fusarium venenatum]